MATLVRLFGDLGCDAFEGALGRWVEAQGVPAREAIALDGKHLRGNRGEAVPGVHLAAT